MVRGTILVLEFKELVPILILPRPAGNLVCAPLMWSGDHDAYLMGFCDV